MGSFTAATLPLLLFIPLRIRAGWSNQLFRGICQNVASSRFEANMYWFIAVRRWDPSRLITLCVYIAPLLFLPVLLWSAPLPPAPGKGLSHLPLSSETASFFPAEFVPFLTAAALPHHPSSVGLRGALLPKHARGTDLLHLPERFQQNQNSIQIFAMLPLHLLCLSLYEKSCKEFYFIIGFITWHSEKGKEHYSDVLPEMCISLQLSAGWSEQ